MSTRNEVKVRFGSSVDDRDQPTVTNEQGGSQAHLPARFDLIPAVALRQVAEVLHEGAQKYGERNWQKIGEADHLNHALAHLYRYLEGDRSEGHLSHALCRILFAASGELKEADHG